MPHENRFHETFDHSGEIKGSSDRSFGLTVGGVLLLVLAYRFYHDRTFDLTATVLLAIGGALVVLSLLRPNLLRPFNLAWIWLGLFLFKVVNPLVMGVIFFVVVTPIGILMRLCGKDPLRLRLDPSAQSYWIDRRPPGPRPETMKDQF